MTRPDGVAAPPARRVLVVSNIPTPYNDALFAEFSRQPGVDLRVVYGAPVEANRAWRLPDEKAYAHEVLPGWTLAGSAHVNPHVLRTIRAFDPHTAVLTGSYAMPTVRLAAAALRARGTPWLYWGEELAHGDAPAVVRSARVLLRRVLRRARGVLAIGSRACASYVRAGVARERVTDFRYYADADRFALPDRARDNARAAVRGSLGLGDGAFAVLYCGQLIGRKGVDTLLRAVHRLGAGDGPADGRAHVLLAGDGPERSALHALAVELGIAERVHFLGFHQPEALPRVFAAGDAFVLPSHSEGWGLVVPEAMAAGLPVFASERVNSAADLVRDGVNGGVFAAADDAELARLLRVVARDPARRAAMAGHARAAVRAETPAIAARRLATLIIAAASGQPIAGL